MKERVLITGASGFVGYHLIVECLAKDLEVYAAVRATSQLEHLRSLPVKFVQLDFTNIAALKAALAQGQYTYIIHAAGVTKAANEAAYTRVNADYTRNLCAAASEVGVKKFVLLSSLAALGPGNTAGQAITEQDTPHPVTLYGKSKLLGEQYALAFKELPLIVLRPTAVYGPRDRDIFIVLKTLTHGVEPYIGRQDQKLSFIYVKDLAAITIEALFSPVRHACYNVADGYVYNRYALCDIAKQILNKSTLRIHLPLPVVRTMALVQEKLAAWKGKAATLNRDKLAELTAANWSCSIERLQQELGIVPRFDLQSGLGQTLQWYKENNWL
jgi:nucleoside-diphosphate-sugar epimerase